MKLYERLGLNNELHLRIERRIKDLQHFQASPSAPDSVKFSKEIVITYTHGLALAFYLDDNMPDARNWGQQTLDHTEDFFFGEWRKKGYQADKKNWADERYIHTRDTWIGEYRIALFWSLVLKDKKKLLQFAGYTDDDCADESNFTEYKASDRAWYILLAKFLRGESSPSAFKPHLEQIEKGKKKKAKLLMGCFLALALKNPALFKQTLADYLKYYKAHEFSGRGLSDKLAIDATMLVHLAEQNGLQVAPPDRYRDYVVRLE